MTEIAIRDRPLTCTQLPRWGRNTQSLANGPSHSFILNAYTVFFSLSLGGAHFKNTVCPAWVSGCSIQEINVVEISWWIASCKPGRPKPCGRFERNYILLCSAEIIMTIVVKKGEGKAAITPSKTACKYNTGKSKARRVKCISECPVWTRIVSCCLDPKQWGLETTMPTKLVTSDSVTTCHR